MTLERSIYLGFILIDILVYRKDKISGAGVLNARLLLCIALLSPLNQPANYCLKLRFYPEIAKTIKKRKRIK